MRIVPALLILIIALTGCTDPAKTISAVGYRNAVSLGTQQELARHGIPLRHRPDCHSPGSDTATIGSNFTVDCTASTQDGSAVTVRGRVLAAGTPHQREEYLVRTGGQIVLRTHCLGIGCR